MPKDATLNKILVIGSGPIVIGQAAEFDYAGTQACQALKEEGLEVVLVNSNPATIMTDTHMADQVYIEPLTIDFLTQVIRKERPDGLLPTLGGQTGLNLAVELAKEGILEREGVRLLGTDLRAITCAEDRDQFRSLMKEIDEPIPHSTIVDNVDDAITFAERIVILSLFDLLIHWEEQEVELRITNKSWSRSLKMACGIVPFHNA